MKHNVWMRCAVLIACCLTCLPLPAQADRVHLIGGAVIEGNAVRVGEKVLVDVQAGQLSLPVASVVRIEESETDVERVQQRLAKLKPDDVKGMLALARFCHDHDMRARERELLLKVIAVQPDQAEARARLGYVRSREGHWLTRDEQRRAEGLVPYRGAWVTQAELLELERRASEARIAALAREKAELELATQKVELEKKRLEAQREREATGSQHQPAPSVVYATPWVGGAGNCQNGTCMPAGFRGPKPFPIPGVRDPRDMTFSIPGAKDPRSYY